MNYKIEDLLKERVFFHFYQICQIPHQSGNEKALSNYIVNWAKSLHLDVTQDSYSNVLIKKPATSGHEQLPSVMLQAHLDMVCEKAAGVTHDFTRDPISWVIDGDVLSTGGKTTLGADDGIGIALSMAILESETLEHPALEVLFTTMEEEDLSGAKYFDTTDTNAQYLINLDHVSEKEILCGSCGGMQTDIQIPVEPLTIPEGWASYQLSVSGLRGGHSGEDIHRGRGNANIVLVRALMALENICEFYLNRITGGSFRLAIPRDAKALLWFEPSKYSELQEILRKFEKEIQNEHAVTQDKISITLKPANAAPWGVISDSVINVMLFVPDGIYQMNELFTGLVDTSNNLGEIYLNDRELHLVTEIRSAHESSRTFLFQKMERLAKMFGGSCTMSNAYPSWTLRSISPFRQLCSEIYEKQYGRKPSLKTVHAGLEVGYFCIAKPDIDAIAIGADCWDFHSPGESVRISSVQKTYDFLCQILASIR
ncbi:MAG: beta-Ala-His dipeptidase [Dorea sp.]